MQRRKLSSTDRKNGKIGILDHPHEWALGQQYHSLTQAKAWKYLVFRAMPTLVQGSIHEIPLGDISRALGYTNITQLKKDLLQMKDIQLDWSKVHPSYSGNSTILPDVRFEDSQKDICTYSFSNLVVRDIINKKQYERLDVALLLGFKSKYALKVYELAKHYFQEKLNRSTQTPIFTIKELRKILNVPANKYKTTYDFISRCITTPLNEVNAKSSMLVTFIQTDNVPRYRKYYFKMSKSEAGKEPIITKEEINKCEFVLMDIPLNERELFWQWLRADCDVFDLPENYNAREPMHNKEIEWGLKYWPDIRENFIKNPYTKDSRPSKTLIT